MEHTSTVRRIICKLLDDVYKTFFQFHILSVYVFYERLLIKTITTMYISIHVHIYVART
jgi:hypothetical protein